MKTAFYPVILLVLFVFTSCGYESRPYKELKARTDFIIAEHELLQAKLQDYKEVLITVNENIDAVATSDETQIPPIVSNLSKEENDLINAGIDKVNQMIQASKGEVDKLKQQLRRSAFRLSELEEEVNRVSRQLEDEKAKVAQLQQDLAEKDKIIENLNNTVLVLTAELETTLDEISQLDAMVKKQDDQLHAAYYIIARKAELKKNDIYKGGLFTTDFRQNAFTEIDTRELTVIELPASAKGKVLTHHSESSYKITKEGKIKTLHITNPDKFWKVSKYLVIE